MLCRFCNYLVSVHFSLLCVFSCCRLCYWCFLIIVLFFTYCSSFLVILWVLVNMVYKCLYLCIGQVSPVFELIFFYPIEIDLDFENEEKITILSDDEYSASVISLYGRSLVDIRDYGTGWIR
ncbi:OLC1v1006022C1 [Oldenlandia corymbosa var. corymbosa]|uniref:OLC1v1006022C1 n=1 Tax=Oldenlandia corymbosa var. corymbosa TaxID=529605 RepID=A0AAV1DJE8_OLDCO|nr:OLC1v1006022C1 [Oldenlandia corymbosa var. corymbosa]